MKKSILLALPLLLVAPLLLLLLVGASTIETVRAACPTTAITSSDMGTEPAPGDAGSGVDLGVMPTDIKAIPGGPVRGQILTANANIRMRSGATPGLRALAAASPDFITLNEVGDVPLSQMTTAAPAYEAYRDPTVDRTEGGTSQSLNNVVLWRIDTWTRRDGGRIKIVDNDQGYIHGERFLWDRYATWATFSRADGAVVSVIATHHMTNVYKAPRQWGDPPTGRADQYQRGMDYLIQLVELLRPYGPVVLGGDMNSHRGDGHAAAVARMAAAGYSFTKDSGVIYNFYAAPVTVTSTWQIAREAVHSDHPALLTRMAMNAAGPASPHVSATPGLLATGRAGCPPCSSAEAAISATVPHARADGSLRDAEPVAAVAYRAGFRGEDLVTAVAIARVESSWDARASTGSHYGLWQIAASHRGVVPGWNAPEDIFNPILNARYAYALYQRRPGQGEAKFADWLPFETADYHQYLELAQQAVTVATGDPGVTNPGIGTHTPDGAATACAPPPMVAATELSAELSARIDAMLRTPHGLCALAWTHGAPCTYDNQCPKVVDALYGGPGVGRGYGNGQDVAQGIISAGLAQARGTGLDPLPPVGAVVSYNSGNGTGHVAIYVGNGRIFGNDYGCSSNGVYGCVGFADVHTPTGSVTWALPKQTFDLGGTRGAAA